MQRLLMAAALVAVFACTHGEPPHRDDAPRISAKADATVVDAAVADAVLVDATVDAARPDAAAKRLGKHGDVCRTSRPGPRDVLTCGPGLHCCYPCGIQGCAFTCMTPAECDVTRP